MGDSSFPILPGVTAADLEHLPNERLESELCALAAQSASAMCRWLVMVAEFDRREAAFQWYGILSTAHWLAWRCAIDARTARDHVRVARAIVGLPKTMAAFASGELTYSKVRAITRVATINNEEPWLYLARHATTAQLEDAVRAYRRAVDSLGKPVPVPGDVDDSPGECRERHSEDGRTQILFDLPADEAAEVLAKLDRRAEELFHKQEGCGSAEPPLRLSHAERRARALVEMAAEALPSSASDPDDDRYLVVIHAKASTLGLNAWMEGGGPIAPSRLAEILCDQPLSLLIEDDDDNPLYLGRTTKTLNRRQRRALRYRDGRCCRVPGCLNTRRLNGHHVAWWERDKGPTDIDNLVSLCPFHHSLVHKGKLFIKVDGDGRFVFSLPDGTVLVDAPETSPVQTTIEEANATAGVRVATAPLPGEGDRQDLALTLDGLLLSFGLLV